jgi:PAS domain S-box-containing protein
MAAADTKTIIEIGGGIIGAIVGAITIYKFVWPKVKRWLMSFVGYDRISAQLAEVSDKLGRHVADVNTKGQFVEKQLADIIKEIHPNGGTSMKDALGRIERTQLIADQRQKAIISDLDYGTWETNEQGLVIWVNRTLCRMTGRTPNEILGHGWINMIATEDRERVHKEWDESIADAREFELEYNYATPEGERVKVLSRTIKMVSANGATIGFFGIAKKIEDGIDEEIIEEIREQITQQISQPACPVPTPTPKPKPQPKPQPSTPPEPLMVRPPIRPPIRPPVPLPPRRRRSS